MVNAVRPLRGIKVLVADDNRDAANAVRRLLCLWGFEVTTAFDGEAALEKAREFRPDLVLCDIAMPRLDGYGVARRIRSGQEFGSPKLIAVTAFDGDDQRRLTHEAGFDLHVVKADDPSRLNHAINQLL